MYYELLKSEIHSLNPEILEIKVGQVFNSKYYGHIVATKINSINGKVFDVYGFDILDGLPRSNYYPKDLELVGLEPTVNDVLKSLPNGVAIKLEDNKLIIDDDIV